MSLIERDTGGCQVCHGFGPCSRCGATPKETETERNIREVRQLSGRIGAEMYHIFDKSGTPDPIKVEISLNDIHECYRCFSTDHIFPWLHISYGHIFGSDIRHVMYAWPTIGSSDGFYRKVIIERIL